MNDNYNNQNNNSNYLEDDIDKSLTINDNNIFKEEPLKTKKQKKPNIIFTIISILITSFIAGFTGYTIYYNSDFRSSNKQENIPEQTISYKCNEGYELIDERCIMQVEDIDPSIEYYCDNGYQLVNDKCIKQEYNSEYVVTWSCPIGYEMGTEREVDICYKYTTNPLSIQKYYCPSGYTLYGTKCKSTSSEAARLDYLCDKGYGGNYNKNDGLCHYMVVTNTCQPGSWIAERYGNKLVKCVSNPTLIYTCPDGSLSKTPTCSTTEEIDAKYLMGCSGEYKLDQVNNICVKTEYDVPSYTISCKTGYQWSNDRCVKNISIKAHANTFCQNGYEFIENRCIKYDIQSPIEYYK